MTVQPRLLLADPRKRGKEFLGERKGEAAMGNDSVLLVPWLENCAEPELCFKWRELSPVGKGCSFGFQESLVNRLA